MFKRGQDYLMEMDVELDYSAFEQIAQKHGRDLAEIKELTVQALSKSVQTWAKEAVKEAGQKWKGAQLDPGGEWPRFQVRFQGDSEGAVAAFDLWGEKVGISSGIKRILKASLRGSDGTNLQYMDEEHEKELMATFDALPPEMQDQIDKMMEPER
jgi:hypothetical protein